MRLNKSFKIALNIILHSKLRSWLTIIGIVIGIAAVVAIVSIGQGAQQSLQSNLNSLSADTITISQGASRAFGAGSSFREGPPGTREFGGNSGTSTSKNLTVSDVQILKGISNVKQVMGIISGSSSNVSYLDKKARVSIEGVDPSVWKEITSTEISYGRYLSQGDTGVAVLGASVANSTFNGIELGRQISISGRIFRIVGVLKESGGQDDSKVFVSIDDAILVLDGKNKKSFDSITIKVKDISLIDSTIAEITDKLMASHGILQSNKQDFSVNSAKSMQERISSTINSMSLFLTAIAAISLLVGAIGIMNTMFTSVLEKTREIGILKAIGAKDRDILVIFLLNSGIIGLIGGIFGVIFGIIGSSYVSQLIGGSSFIRGPFGIASSVSPTMVMEVFLLAVGIGLIAGAIPAYRASRLEPVEALRYE